MYLGIDLGTSGVKATLIDDDQAIVGAGSAPLDVSRPQPGWSEQNPHDWIAAAEQAVGALRAANADALAAVRGVGLSGQMHGATLLDGRLRGERDVDHARDARRLHHVDHGLMRRVRVGVDHHHRVLRVAAGAAQDVGERLHA